LAVRDAGPLQPADLEAPALGPRGWEPHAALRGPRPRTTDLPASRRCSAAPL